MKNSFLRIIVTLLACAFLFSVAPLANAQDVDKNIENYVARKGKRARVPTEINKVVTGDIDGDGSEDVAVQYILQTGYPGNDFISYLAVFLNKKGRLTFAAETTVGAKLAGSIVPLEIKNRRIVCDNYNASNERVGAVEFKLARRRLIRLRS